MPCPQPMSARSESTLCSLHILACSMGGCSHRASSGSTLDIQATDSTDSTPDMKLLTGDAEGNAGRPINRLPPELLVDILMHLKSRTPHDHPDAPNGRPWFELMRVCRHWHAIVVSNPCFWRTIHTGERTRWLHLALARSGEATLRLTFSRSCTLAAALPSLQAPRERIERLDFNCPTRSGVREVAPLISAPLPRMTEFSISANERRLSSPDSPEELLEFRPENFPTLGRLTLAHASLPWSAALLSRLRSLDLRGCQAKPPSIGLRDFLDVLQRGEMLEELVLHDFLSASCARSPGPPEPAPAVILPRLRKLDVSDTLLWIAGFLAHVHLPSQGEVTLTGQIDFADIQVNDAISYASMLPRDRDRLSFLRSATSARICVMDSVQWVVLDAPSGPLAVTLQLRARAPGTPWIQSPDDGLKHFTALFGTAPLTALTLQCELAKVAPSVLATTLDWFPRLRELTIASGAFGPDPFPLALCTCLRASPAWAQGQEENEKGVQPVRCLALAVLRLERVRWEDGAFVYALVECLRERERLGARRLDMLAIGASRASEVDWSEVDGRFAEVIGPLVGTYEFTGSVW
ncbi:hypothetical protein C8Q77DRAFT_1126690 [Trametes polyzona]|nr:hypothetical protein C8Q77DRAFT_1126690 [Trametes polyzona]